MLRHATALAVLAGLALTAAPASPAADDGELKTGQKILAQFERRHDVLMGTRYNAVVDPIAKRIAAAAQSQYGQPLQYVVIKGKEINAFAVPGGFMFIYAGLIDAVRTKDELAGVMCHETSHTLHHDSTNLMKTAVQRAAALTVASIFLPGAGTMVRIAGDASDFQMAHFSRHVETAADLTGADLCAQAGYNPYGLVWMMETFQGIAGGKSSLEMLSNHPRDDHRISDLVDHFKAAPATFDAFRSDVAWGTPIAALGDGASPPAFPSIVCPRAKPDDGRSAAKFAAWWGALGAVAAFNDAAAVPAAARPDGDLVTLPGNLSWYRFDETLGGIVAGFDPAAHAVATCADDLSGARLDVVEEVPAAPPEGLPTVDLSSLRTSAGIGLGVKRDAVLAAYGAATPVHLADGRDVYAWERTAPNGDRRSARVAMRDGEVVGYELRTRLGAVATPEPLPTNPAAAK